MFHIILFRPQDLADVENATSDNSSELGLLVRASCCPGYQKLLVIVIVILTIAALGAFGFAIYHIGMYNAYVCNKTF